MTQSMENVIFAMGPNDSFFYNTPKLWYRNNMPEELEGIFGTSTVADVAVLSLGPRVDSYFMRYKYTGADGYDSVCWADKLPQRLLNWLVNENGRIGRDRQTVQVVLGPNESFFAWDQKGIRWSSIPVGLSELIQGWLSPAGWIAGPPRIVALGKDGAWFAMSQYGKCDYHAPASCDAMLAFFDTFKEAEALSNIEKVFMNPSVADSFVVVLNTTRVFGHKVLSTEKFREASKSIATPELAKEYEQEWREADEAERKQEAERKRAEQEQKRKSREEQETRERLRPVYQHWHDHCARLREGHTPLTVFPHLPAHHCNCTETSCVVRKEARQLKACRHDVEKLLRASGQYDVAWLRKERLAWHPDRWQRRCNEDIWKDMMKPKVEEMYVIFEELISAEAA